MFLFDKDGNFIDLLPHQRIMDDKIKMLFLKDLDYRDCFIHILIENYKIMDTTLQMPDIIVKATNDFIESNNPIYGFIKTYLLKTNDPKNEVSFKDLYTQYCSMMMFNKDEKDILPKKKFTSLLNFNEIETYKKGANNLFIKNYCMDEVAIENYNKEIEKIEKIEKIENESKKAENEPSETVIDM